MQDAVGKYNAPIARKPVGNQGKSLVSFHVTWAFEELIQRGGDQALRRDDITFHCHFIGKLPVDQAIVIGKVNSNASIHRCPRGRRNQARHGCGRRCGARSAGESWR